MADDTTDTTPGSAPGVLKTSADGSLPEGIGGRRAWVWMQDSEEGGGGRFDVLAIPRVVKMWLARGARVVPNYPLHFGPSGRLARPRANLAGAPAGAPAVSGGTPPPDDQAAEGTDQAAGGSAAAETTTNRKARTR